MEPTPSRRAPLRMPGSKVPKPSATKVRLERMGISGNRLALTLILVFALVAYYLLDDFSPTFSHWWDQHALTASITANVLVLALSLTLYDQFLRIREARSLVQDHDLWNLRSMVDRASETICRALLIWEGAVAEQHNYLKGEETYTEVDGVKLNLNRGQDRARYTLAKLPVALADPHFYAVKCVHHRVIHHSLHECMLYDLEKFESYLLEYSQRYRDTGYPDFWLAVDAAEAGQQALDGIVHQLRNVHNPHHPASPRTIVSLFEEYFETRRSVSECAHRYGRPKTDRYVPVEFTR